MAGKKGRINNADFLSQIAQSSRNSTKEVHRVLAKAKEEELIEPGKKKIQYIDVDMMEDAPENWNRYPKLKDSQLDKYLELKLSIYEKGVEEPCILWQQIDDTYMILAGHNRRQICKEIISENKDTRGFEESKFRFLPSIVYGTDEIDDAQAQQIIDDTNLYRDFSRLPARVKMEIMRNRMEVYKKRKYSKGERIDQLAKEFGIEKSAIYENLMISEKICKPLQELYYEGKLSRKAVIRFNYFAGDTQEWIYENFKDDITEDKVKALKKSMGREDIRELFQGKKKETKKISFDIPADRVDEFRRMYEQWLESLPED